MPYSVTSLIGAIPAMIILGGLMPCIFISQQHRLLGMAPQHANVIVALNGTANYLGMASGAALGGAVLHYAAVSQLGWVGAVCMLVALPLFIAGSRGRVEKDFKQVNISTGMKAR